MHITEIREEIDLLASNREFAERNRSFFRNHGVTVFNIMGAIGSGKTMLIEKTVEVLIGEYRIGVILGDVICDADRKRLERYEDVKIEAINTGKECHLDAKMIFRRISKFSDVDLLLIENVGNLVCPVDFDLGEAYRVVMVSVTEGDDVVEKHPDIVRIADVLIINKVSLSHAVDASPDKILSDAENVNKRAVKIKMDLKDGTGFDKWLEFIRRSVE